MIVKKSDAILRKWKNIEIWNYITKSVCDSISFSIAELDWIHNKTKNIESDRIYYILEWEAIIEIENEKTNVSIWDVIFIPKGKVHSMFWKVKYIVLNSPSFDIKNEVSI